MAETNVEKWTIQADLRNARFRWRNIHTSTLWGRRRERKAPIKCLPEEKARSMLADVGREPNTERATPANMGKSTRFSRHHPIFSSRTRARFSSLPFSLLGRGLVLPVLIHQVCEYWSEFSVHQNTIVVNHCCEFSVHQNQTTICGGGLANHNNLKNMATINRHITHTNQPIWGRDRMGMAHDTTHPHIIFFCRLLACNKKKWVSNLEIICFLQIYLLTFFSFFFPPRFTY